MEQSKQSWPTVQNGMVSYRGLLQFTEACEAAALQEKDYWNRVAEGLAVGHPFCTMMLFIMNGDGDPWDFLEFQTTVTSARLLAIRAILVPHSMN